MRQASYRNFIAHLYWKGMEINRWINNREKVVNLSLILILIAGLIGTIPVTISLFGISDTPGLRGDSFLKFSAPEDYQAIQFLRILPGIIVLLKHQIFTEMINTRVKFPHFQVFHRLLGQYQHEILWRSHLEGVEGINQKIMSTRLIYEEPDLTVPLMDMNGLQSFILLVQWKEILLCKHTK
jgi:hypothetical protein